MENANNEIALLYSAKVSFKLYGKLQLEVIVKLLNDYQEGIRIFREYSNRCHKGRISDTEMYKIAQWFLADYYTVLFPECKNPTETYNQCSLARRIAIELLEEERLYNLPPLTTCDDVNEWMSEMEKEKAEIDR